MLVLVLIRLTVMELFPSFISKGKAIEVMATMRGA